MNENNKAASWAGWILSTLLAALLIGMSGASKVTRAPMAVEGFEKFGYPDKVLVPLGVVEIVATILFMIPQTSVLGAVLLTGYLGGAVATHVRGDDPPYMPIVIGVLVWVALILRDPRVRSLLPLRRNN